MKRAHLTRRALALTLLLALAVSLPARASEQLAVQLKAAWSAVEAQRLELARYPVRLRDGDFNTLAGGKHVARIVRSPEGDRIEGALHIEASLEAMWVALHQTESRDTGDGVSQSLLKSSPSRRVLFVYMDAPWPMQNRQAVVEVRYNAPLMAATSGDLWERAWRIGEPGLATAADPEALWMPVNNGAWQMLRLNDGSTLAALSLSVDVGGAVPTEAAVRWGVATLGSVLRDLEDTARRAPSIYKGDHEVFYRPDGQPIPVGSL